MLKLRIIIIALSLTACNTLTEPQAHAALSKGTIETDNIGNTTDASSISSRRDDNVAADPKVSTSQASSSAEFDDIWMRIRDQLELDHHDARKKVKSKLAWNDLNAPSVLRPGKKLNLWLSENMKNTAQAIPVNYNAESEPVITYTVKKGDSLWLIARRFQTNVAQLRSLNNLDNKKYLHSGQKLLIRNTRTGISGA